jgi:hypothetical protein
MNKTNLMATVLAVATVLTAGLTVLPSSVQEAQANPCSVEGTTQTSSNTNTDNDVLVGDNGGPSDDDDVEQTNEQGVETNCEFYGPVEINEP